jgi:hypothetical protein
MIRIPGEIDRYISEGKLKLSLKKDRRVMPVIMDKISSNGLGKEDFKKKKESEPFDDILKEEIKKISSRK